MPPSTFCLAEVLTFEVGGGGKLEVFIAGACFFAANCCAALYGFGAELLGATRDGKLSEARLDRELDAIDDTSAAVGLWEETDKG